MHFSFGRGSNRLSCRLCGSPMEESAVWTPIRRMSDTISKNFVVSRHPTRYIAYSPVAPPCSSMLLRIPSKSCRIALVACLIMATSTGYLWHAHAGGDTPHSHGLGPSPSRPDDPGRPDGAPLRPH